MPCVAGVGFQNTLSGKLEAQAKFLRACAIVRNFVINSVNHSLEEGDEHDNEEYDSVDTG